MSDNNQDKNVDGAETVKPMEVNQQEDAGLDSDDEGGILVDGDIYIPPPPKKASELDANGPRLVVEKIVNQNFKSYAGTVVLGPFHQCFSAIVGPNGSGKSNVIDSLLFVFGFRATKIRSRKMSELIHNSSECPNVQSCSVAIHFRKIIDKSETEYEVVPESNYVISRTVCKDDSSYYELNNRKVQFKEIAKRLRSDGVDLDHNRFLILQGEVEQIALMKPKAQKEHETGMLEFLEDIIGTVRFKEPLIKLFDRIEQITEYRVEKLNRLRAVQKDKDSLEEPMQGAVQYLKIENEITKSQHQLYQCKKYGTEQECTKIEEKKQELDGDITKLSEEMKTVLQEKQEKQKELKEKCKKWDVLQKECDAIADKFNEIDKKDKYTHQELVTTSNRRKENKASLTSEKEKLEQLLKVPAKNEKNIAECENLLAKQIKDKEKEEERLATIMDGLREKTEPLVQKRTTEEKQLLTLRKEVDETQAAYNIAKTKFDLYISSEQVEHEKLAKLKEESKKITETLEERRNQLKSLEMKIPATEKSLKKAQKDLEDNKVRETEATSKLKKMRMSYEETRSAMQASSSRNKILNSLMEQRKEGRIPGIYGRLGDLGAIDVKYDVAISTACGPLDDIVVDTVATAEACISFLRKNDIGRATFIPLEKQQRLLPQCQQKIQTPENVHRLFDLIKVEDADVLPAFYYGLRDTLVAEDLDQATRIAYGAKRYRVVTLRGDLIELSGTMSGGGRTVYKGRMGQKVVRNDPSVADVEKLQVNLDAVFEECNKLKRDQQQLQNQVNTLSNALKEMTIEREKYRIEVMNLKEQEPQLREQMKIQEKKAAQTVSDPKVVKQLTKEVEIAQKKLEKAQEVSQAVEDEVADLNRQIEQITAESKAQQKKITNLTKSIENTKGEICKLQVAIKTAERNTKKCEQRITSLEENIKDCEQKLIDLKDQKTAFEKEALAILEIKKGLEEQLQERNEVAGSLKKEMDTLSKRENNMKAVKIDLDQKLAENAKIIKELRNRIQDYERRIDNIKLHEIPYEETEELRLFSKDELETLEEKTVVHNLQRLKEKLPPEIPNMQIIEEYREKQQLYLKRLNELEEITEKRDKLRGVYDNARARRMEEFLAGFTIITTKVKELYRMITLGGDAELELVDSLDPFSEGIAFSVRPPKKSWKNISNLSGGEKTLSSLALVFALHHYKPTPLYFMDEIDAALDFKNVSIVGNYIKDRTKDAQFIIVSLRPNMFEIADCLVGIYKTYDCTKTVTVDLIKYYKIHEIEPPAQLTQLTAKKTQFGSQFVKPMTQVPVAQKENHAPIDTSPTRNEKSPEPSNHNVSTLRLPDLALCPTPQKEIDERRDMNETSESEVSSNLRRKYVDTGDNEETSIRRNPRRKKQKVIK